jgi:small GTP-binding protein
MAQNSSTAGEQHHDGQCPSLTPMPPIKITTVGSPSFSSPESNFKPISSNRGATFFAGVELKQLKFVTIGDGAVGKTSLLISFTRNQFSGRYVPTVFDNKSIVVTLDGADYQIGLWDTAGQVLFTSLIFLLTSAQEEYDRLRPLSYPSTDCFLMCFSISSPPSYDNCRLKWKPEVNHYNPNARIILIGTKKDLRDDSATNKKLDEELHVRPVSRIDGEKLMVEIGCASYLGFSSPCNSF